MVGAEYEKVELKNVYKSMNVAKPDLIMVQLRPD